MDIMGGEVQLSRALNECLPLEFRLYFTVAGEKMLVNSKQRSDMVRSLFEKYYSTSKETCLFYVERYQLGRCYKLS